MELEKTVRIRVSAPSYDELIPKAMERVAFVAYDARLSDGTWTTPHGVRVRGQITQDAEINGSCLFAYVQVGLEPPF